MPIWDPQNEFPAGLAFFSALLCSLLRNPEFPAFPWRGLLGSPNRVFGGRWSWYVGQWWLKYVSGTVSEQPMKRDDLADAALCATELWSGNAWGAFLQTPAPVLNEISGPMGARFSSCTGSRVWHAHRGKKPPSSSTGWESVSQMGCKFNRSCENSACLLIWNNQTSKGCSLRSTWDDITLSWRTFRIFLLFFSVWGGGKGRKRPSRWRGAVFGFFVLKIEAGGVCEEGPGGGTIAERMSARRGGGAKFFFFRGRNAHQALIQKQYLPQTIPQTL